MEQRVPRPNSGSANLIGPLRLSECDLSVVFTLSNLTTEHLLPVLGSQLQPNIDIDLRRMEIAVDVRDALNLRWLFGPNLKCMAVCGCNIGDVSL